MQHRHLVNSDYSAPAVDDIIARGRRADWAALGQAMRRDQKLRETIKRVCAPRIADPYAQRYHFWNRYADRAEPA